MDQENQIKNFVMEQSRSKKTIGLNEICAHFGFSKKKVAEDLRKFLEETIQSHPDGLTITQLTAEMKINRNWIAKQLDVLFLLGRVDRKTIGPAKLYFWSKEGLNRWEKYYLALLENASDLITVLTPTPQGAEFAFISQSVERILGYTPKELEGQPIEVILHPDDLNVLERLHNYADGKSQDNVIFAKWKHKNGTWRQMEATLTDLTEDPNVNGIILNCRDLTDTILLDSHLQYRVVFERFMLDLSREFISHPISEIDQVITDSLKMIGKFLTQNANQGFILSPERICLQLFSADQTQQLESHTWNSEDVSQSVKTHSPQSINAKKMAQNLNQLKLNEVVYFGNLAKLPENMILKDLLSFSGLTQGSSCILLPLLHSEAKSKELQGFFSIGFSQMDAIRTEDAKEMLMHFVGIIQAALKRLKLEKEVDIFEYFLSLV